MKKKPIIIFLFLIKKIYINHRKIQQNLIRIKGVFQELGIFKIKVTSYVTFNVLKSPISFNGKKCILIMLEIIIKSFIKSVNKFT